MSIAIFTAPPALDTIRRMRRATSIVIVGAVAMATAGLGPPAAARSGVAVRDVETSAQAAATDPVVGNWRGTLTSSAGTESAIIITIARSGDGYAGATNGLNAASESPLRRVTVNGARVSIEAAGESTLGPVSLASDLTAEGNSLKGAGTLTIGALHFDVTLALQRRPRQEAIQPHVEQRIDYFAGRWTFEYLGADYPPLSAGDRSGTVTFTRSGASNFVAGVLDGDLLGKPYQERLSIGFDPETKMLAFVERRPGGIELVSVANWQSPIAITFHTSPVQANGKTYQLRRFIAVHSTTAFDVTEEFSVDGGPYRRLGTGHYTKLAQ
jgi:hypothetical protein